ncbi:MAG: hypothetical protein ACFE0S_01285 [Rhodospirillales bacterium]
MAVTNIFLSMATLVVAGSVAVITYQQYWVNRLRLRHELFDRRFEVFKAAQRFLSEIMREGRLTDDGLANEYPKFIDAWQRSRFLFNNEIADYLDSIGKRALQLRLHDRRDRHEEEASDLEWLTQQTTVLFEKFRPYLAFPKK